MCDPLLPSEMEVGKRRNEGAEWCCLGLLHAGGVGDERKEGRKEGSKDGRIDGWVNGLFTHVSFPGSAQLWSLYGSYLESMSTGAFGSQS